MTTEQLQVSLSQLTLQSANSQQEDWDRSMQDEPQTISHNTVVFPRNAHPEREDSTPEPGAGKSRTLSELLKVHAEKGTDVNFTPEEASRVAEVLGQWINSSSSPYEVEDDFFARVHAQDDSSISSPSKRSVSNMSLDTNGRPRGQSASVVKSTS